MEVKSLNSNSDLQLIHGYGDGGFRVSGERYSGDLLLFNRRAVAWTHPALERLRFADLEHAFGEDVPPLFLLGVGAAPMKQYLDLAADLKPHGINLEVMSTAAACRTWNVLMSEGRDACAGLIAI